MSVVRSYVSVSLHSKHCLKSFSFMYTGKYQWPMDDYYEIVWLEVVSPIWNLCESWQI